jgi:hypothetical protein
MPLAEDFLVLALDPDTGRFPIGNLRLECGLAAGVLLELAAAGRIELDAGNVACRAANLPASPAAEVALARIKATPLHGLTWWVNELRSGQADLVIRELVIRGALVPSRHRRLLVFTETRCSLADPAVRRAPLDRLRALTRRSGEPGEPDSASPAAPTSAPVPGDTADLLALCLGTGLAADLFPDVPAAELEALAGSPETAGAAVSEAIRTVVRRVIAALIAATAAV